VNHPISADIERWHDFFLLAGTAGVTLMGLLFVAVSLNVAIIMRGNERHLRAIATSAFEAYLFSTILALLMLVPMERDRIHGVALIVIGVVGLVRAIAHVRAAGPAVPRFTRGRLLLPAAAHVVLAITGVRLLAESPDAVQMLITAVVWLLVSATRNAWVLLVEVGEVKESAAREADPAPAVASAPPAAEPQKTPAPDRS
jgi:hypothetical protein